MNLREKPFYLTEEEERSVKMQVMRMTLGEMAGQVFCIMATQNEPEQAELLTMVRDYHVGGILYRPAPAEWIRKQYESLEAEAKYPLLKAANLEEGGVGAVSDGTFFGWPMSLAAAGDPDYARKHAMVCAAEGAEAGVNLTFSPVTDINFNFRNPITNIRTFGADPDTVMAYSREYMKTIQKYGVAACAKHFPGDGVDYRDQHLHPTYNDLPAKEWYSTYGKVYRSLIDDGLMGIMAAHIVQPYLSMQENPVLNFEDCLPASLSRELLTGVLRTKMGFNGIIVTDATIMSGFIQAMKREKAIPAAIEAGCDMLVFSTDFYTDYRYLLDGVKNGLLSMDRLTEAVERILALKTVLNKSRKYPKPDIKDKDLWCLSCAERSITLVKNRANDLPVTKEKFPEIELILLGDDRMGDGGSLTEAWRERLTVEGFAVSQFVPVSGHPGKPELKPGRLKIHIANMGAVSNNTAVRLYWKPMGAQDSPKYVLEQPDIFVSFANPYHLQDIPRIRTCINCYSSSKVIVDTIIDMILGKKPFAGVSPVDPFCGLPDTRI